MDYFIFGMIIGGFVASLLHYITKPKKVGILRRVKDEDGSEYFFAEFSEKGFNSLNNSKEVLFKVEKKSKPAKLSRTIMDTHTKR